MSFVQLHVHSEYSILDGASSVSKIVKKAKNDSMPAVALTDHGNMLGIKEFHAACLKEGIKPLLGCEVYIVEDNNPSLKDNSNSHLVLIAKNKQGYTNLLKLVSDAYLNGYYYKPRISKKMLEKYSEGLIVSTACLGGDVPKTIMRGELDKTKELIEWYKNLFGEDFYLELQLHPAEDPKRRGEIYENQLKVNKKLIDLAKEHDVKYLATNDVHYVNEEDANAHDILLCLSTGKDFEDPNRMRYTRHEWFKTTKEMQELFKDFPEAIETTVEVAEKVETYELDNNPIMPEYPIPEKFGTEEQFRNKFDETALKEEFGEERFEKLGGYESALRIKFEADYLKDLVYRGAKNKYGDNLEESITDRIDFEINTIKSMGFPGYFLIVQDFINEAKSMGVIVGPGRGSAAGSVVAYCLDITAIDPVKYDLLFERFLNPDRISMPDIDIDFDDDGRQQVIDYVVDKYGADKVAHICTFGTMAAKSSLKDVARVLKYPLNLATAITNELPEGGGLGGSYKKVLELESEKGSIDKAITSIDKEIEKFVKEEDKKKETKERVKKFFAEQIVKARKEDDNVLDDVLKYSCELEGTVRQTGVHPCGILIGRNSLDFNIPLMKNKGIELPVTQYDGNYVEDIGLLKMDFLGLKTLSIIKEALENIELSKNIKVDIENVNLNDKNTFDHFSRGETTAIFQFESPGMKKHLRALMPNRIEDLVAMNALYRPGPMEYIPTYIDRKFGREKIEYDHPLMEKYLDSTYGITVFQEQVMLLSRELAGFTRGQSDSLRKAMGKKKFDLMAKLKEKFIEGCLNNPKFTEPCTEIGKKPEELIDKIWKDWEAFASYAFNKSHSVCYAFIAYQTGYLKANFPAEFMAANLSRNLSDADEVSKLMEECRRAKINVLGPDVNESFRKFTVNDKDDVRFGLAAIKGVGEGAVEEIIKEREANGHFKSIYDFVERVPLGSVNKKNIESLALAGAFDNIEGIRREQFFVENNGLLFLDHIIKYGNMYQQDQASSQNSLFGESSEISISKPEIPKAENWGELYKLNKEKELIGIYLSAHPLDEYKFEIKSLTNTSLSEMDDKELLKKRKEIVIAGMVSSCKHLISKKNNPYGILTIEDYTSKHEMFLFGDTYMKNKEYLQQGYFLLISGTYQKKKKWDDKKADEYEFFVKNIDLLSEASEKKIKSIGIEVDVKSINDTLIKEIKSFTVDNKESKTLLKFLLWDYESQTHVSMFSRNSRIKVGEEFIDFIEDNEEIKYKINC